MGAKASKEEGADEWALAPHQEGRGGSPRRASPGVRGGAASPLGPRGRAQPPDASWDGAASRVPSSSKQGAGSPGGRRRRAPAGMGTRDGSHGSLTSVAWSKTAQTPAGLTLDSASMDCSQAHDSFGGRGGSGFSDVISFLGSDLALPATWTDGWLQRRVQPASGFVESHSAKLARHRRMAGLNLSPGASRTASAHSSSFSRTFSAQSCSSAFGTPKGSIDLEHGEEMAAQPPGGKREDRFKAFLARPGDGGVHTRNRSPLYSRTSRFETQPSFGSQRAARTLAKSHSTDELVASAVPDSDGLLARCVSDDRTWHSPSRRGFVDMAEPSARAYAQRVNSSSRSPLARRRIARRNAAEILADIQRAEQVIPTTRAPSIVPSRGGTPAPSRAASALRGACVTSSSEEGVPASARTSLDSFGASDAGDFVGDELPRHHLYAAGGCFVSDAFMQLAEEFAELRVESETDGCRPDRMLNLLFEMNGATEEGMTTKSVDELLQVSWSVGLMTPEEADMCRQEFLRRKARKLRSRCIRSFDL